MEVSPEPSLLQAEQSQLTQPVFTGEMLQHLEHLCVSPLDSFSYFHVFFVLGAPELNTILQVGSQGGRGERNIHFP